MDLYFTLTEIIGLVVAVFATIPYSYDDKKNSSSLGQKDLRFRVTTRCKPDRGA